MFHRHHLTFFFALAHAIPWWLATFGRGTTYRFRLTLLASLFLAGLLFA